MNFRLKKSGKKGVLQPGHMFLVDTVEGRIISDNEIKSKIARQKPYRRWLDENKIELRGLFDAPKLVHTDADTFNPEAAIVRLYPRRVENDFAADGFERPGAGRFDGK